MLKKKFILFFVALLAGLNFFCWQEVFALAGPQKLKVDFLNVGQGDSFFIETPANNKILIDGGPDVTVLQKLGEILPFWDKEIDLVVLTHPDSDHVTGLIDVLQKYKVDNILWNGIVKDGTEYQKWLKVLAAQQKNGARIIIAKAGEEIKSGGVSLDILNPKDSLQGKYFKEDNDTGVVSRLVYGKESFLFTADIDSKEEQKLTEIASSPEAPRNDELKSDVLKVAHHGSKYSTSNLFLAAVQPQIAVISDGKNNTYGFPTPEALQRLQNYDIKVLRTDTNGDIKMVSDGNNITLGN